VQELLGIIFDIISFLFFLGIFFGGQIIPWAESEIAKEGKDGGSDGKTSHCSFDGCRSLTMKSTEFCWKHQDAKPHISDGPAWWEEGGGTS